jgi:hypothetical protein
VIKAAYKILLVKSVEDDHFEGRERERERGGKL